MARVKRESGSATPRKVAPIWAIVTRSQCRADLACINCSHAFGSVHDMGCYEMMKARQHVERHDTVNKNCDYCRAEGLI